MKRTLIKVSVIAILAASAVAAQASLTFSGSISFNPSFALTIPPGGPISLVQQMTPLNVANTSPMPVAQTSGEFASAGISQGNSLVDAVFHPNSGSVYNLAGPGNWEVWSFTWNSAATGGHTYRYSLTSSSFSIQAQQDSFLNIYGTGTLYVKDMTAGGVNVYDPVQAIWTLTGTQTGTTAWGLTTEAVPVPEPTTLVAGALLLLPFGASTYRVLRKGKQAA